MRMENGEWRFKVSWYGFTRVHDTWKIFEELPRSNAMRYFRKRHKVEWPAPDVLDQVMVG